MSAKKLIIGWLLFCFIPASFAVVQINGRENKELDVKMKEGMDLLYRENFSAALRLFEGIRKQYPDHPVGYFLTAAALDARMYFYFTGKEESEFNKNCEKAIELGEAIMQRNPSDKWNIFFTGGAYGYLGTYQNRYKRYITSFRNGWTGVSYLKQIYDADKSAVDVLFGLGLYHYWSSKMAKMLWWMPGIEDKREEGIQELRKVMGEGNYTVQPAATNLMWVLLNEGRIQESMDIAQKFLQKYPNNRIFSFGLAEGYYLTGKLDKAEVLYQNILDLCDSEDQNNNVNTLKCHLFLARIYEKQKMWVRGAAECRRGMVYKYNETDQIVASEYQTELKEILGRIQSSYRPVH